MVQIQIVFIDAALDDLRRVGPSVAPRILKKILLLQHDPEAGEPLGGDLTGYRKLVVGNRQWRVVYRVDDQGAVVICEIWAPGARSDSEVYTEATGRVAAAVDARPALVTLRDTIERLGRAAGAVEATEGSIAEPVPDWLADRLIHTVGMTRATVAGLDAKRAFQLWEEYRASPPPD